MESAHIFYYPSYTQEKVYSNVPSLLKDEILVASDFCKGKRRNQKVKPRNGRKTKSENEELNFEF